MMRRYKIIWILSGLVLFIAGCNQKEFCEFPHPHDENVILKYDWSQGCCKPDDVVVVITMPSGERKTIRTSSDRALFHLPDGNYDLLSYEEAENVLVNGDIARAGVLPDGTLAQVGAFSVGAGRVIVENGKSCYCMIAMKKQFNELNLSLNAKGKDVEMLEEIEGKLGGISSFRDIRNNCCMVTRTKGVAEAETTQTGTVKFDLRQAESTFSGKTRFLGVIDGSKQTLALTMVYTDGSKQTVVLDVTDKIVDVGDTSSAPLPDEIFVELNVEQIKGIITASIVDWKIGTGEDLDAGENRSIK